MTPPACLLASLLIALAFLQGCSRGPSSARNSAPASWPTAVQRGMDRQVQLSRNAELASTGDFEADALRRRVLAAPDDLDARTRLAARYESTGQPELAVEHYRILLARHPEASAPRLNLIRILHSLSLNNPALHDSALTHQALTATEDGLRLHASRQLLSWKGILLDSLDRHADAEPSHREALARAQGASPSTLASLQNNLGNNLLLQKRYADAASALETALSLDRRLETARNNLGTALALSGDPTRALAHWKSLAGPAAAHSNLATLYIESGRHTEARRELNIALGYDPNHPAALRNMAALASIDGRPAVLEPNSVRRASAWAKIAQTFKSTLGFTDSREKTSPTQAAQQ
ncbi:MAG: tetratricopeptide repeat protein [Bryobacterales bacterium]|nr:tetratricopeptide repeat protein [Bryobacterales bacterium]